MPVPRQITLEIDTSGPPIHGRLRAAPDIDRPFTGWISLLAALDETIGRHDSRFLPPSNRSPQSGVTNSPQR